MINPKVGDVVDGPGERRNGKVVHIYGGPVEECPLPVIVEWPNGVRVPYAAAELTLGGEPLIDEKVGFYHWQTGEWFIGTLLERYRVTTEPLDEYGRVQIDSPQDKREMMTPAFHRLRRL